MTNPDAPVLYFDGVCNLCNGVVQFFIRNDRKQIFRFASLQSKAGERALKTASAAGKEADSVILFMKGNYYVRSEAVLRALMALGGGWRLSGAALVIPGFIRDKVYDLIARKRYSCFGKRESCMIPTPELKARFVED